MYHLRRLTILKEHQKTLANELAKSIDESKPVEVPVLKSNTLKQNQVIAEGLKELGVVAVLKRIKKAERDSAFRIFARFYSVFISSNKNITTTTILVWFWRYLLDTKKIDPEKEKDKKRARKELMLFKVKPEDWPDWVRI